MRRVARDGVTTRSLKRSPNRQDVAEDMEDASSASEWHTHCKYAGHEADDAQSCVGVNVGWKQLRLPSRNLYVNNSEGEDPNGDPLEMDEEDPELARKRKELQVIEERILLKKAAIALKTVEPLLKKTTFPDLSCDESATCFALKDRVNSILQQRHHASFFTEFRSSRERTDSFSRSKDVLMQDDHPLKLRVKALMQRRYSNPTVLPKSREVPVFTPPPSNQKAASPDNENNVNKGFQRFLSILNKGVDMDFLSRIVNDDSVDLPFGEERLNLQPSAAENNSDTTFRRESQRSDSGSSLPCSSQTNSGERNTDLPSQERSLSDRLSFPDDDNDEKKNDRSRTKSPSAVKKEEEKSKSQVDEQREQLQNILKTLGMSLDLEEMSKLADRTQERLYGKKRENTRLEQENQQRASQKPRSMSSPSASSSRSTSRSHSSSPSRRQYSYSRESRPRSERGHSRDTSGDGLTCRDGNEVSKEERTYSNKDEEYPQVSASYQLPYPPNHTYPQPAAHSAFAFDNILSQDSQYSAYDSGTYNAASNSYWASTQGAIPPSFYPSGCPYSQNAYHNVSGFAVAPNMVYCPQRNSFGAHNDPRVNPDLSKSEGQTGSISGDRYLHVVHTGRSRCIQTLTKGHKRKGKLETHLKSCQSWKRKGAAKKLKRELKNRVTPRLNKSVPEANLFKKGEAPQLKDDDPEAEQSKEVKHPPTEVEVKENLRKKLEAFNQKINQKVTKPANSLPS